MPSWFQKQLKEATDSLKKTVIKVRSQSFLESAIAAFALAAHAGGALKPEAKLKMMNFAGISEALSAFDPKDIDQAFEQYVRHYRFDPVVAETAALDIIARLKGREAEARLLMRACIVIAGADGVFSAKELAAVHKICAALGLDPADFDLESAQPAVPAPAAVPTLEKGGRFSLSRQAPGVKRLHIGLGWEPLAGEFDIDVSAFLLAADAKVRSDADFVFYNQPRSTCGAVEHKGNSDPDRQLLAVDLEKIPAEIQRIAITATLHEAEQRGQRFSQVRNAYLRLIDPAAGTEIVRYELKQDAGDETAMIFGELYRHGEEWKFTAVGQGYVGGLAAMCRRFGVVL